MPTAFHTEYMTPWAERARIFWEMYHRLRALHHDDLLTGEEVTGQVLFTLQILPTLVYTDYLPDGKRLSRRTTPFDRSLQEAQDAYIDEAGEYCATWSEGGSAASLAVIEAHWKVWGAMLRDALTGKPL